MKIFFEESSICAFRCFYHALYKGGSFESSLEFLFAAFFYVADAGAWGGVYKKATRWCQNNSMSCSLNIIHKSRYANVSTMPRLSKQKNTQFHLNWTPKRRFFAFCLTHFTISMIFILVLPRYFQWKWPPSIAWSRSNGNIYKEANLRQTASCVQGEKYWY